MSWRRGNSPWCWDSAENCEVSAVAFQRGSAAVLGQDFSSCPLRADSAGIDVQKTGVFRSCISGQSGHARCCDDRCMEVHGGAVLEQGFVMPVVSTTGA